MNRTIERWYESGTDGRLYRAPSCFRSAHHHLNAEPGGYYCRECGEHQGGPVKRAPATPRKIEREPN